MSASLQLTAGIQERLEQRRAQLQPMLGHEPPRFQTRTEPPRPIQMVRSWRKKPPVMVAPANQLAEGGAGH